MKNYLAMKFRYDKGIEGVSEIMYCVTGKSGGGLAILPLIVEIEGKEMTLQERIDEMYRQLETTKPTSTKKIRDLKKGIARAEYQRRKQKRNSLGSTELL